MRISFQGEMNEVQCTSQSRPLAISRRSVVLAGAGTSGAMLASAMWPSAAADARASDRRVDLEGAGGHWFIERRVGPPGSKLVAASIDEISGAIIAAGEIPGQHGITLIAAERLGNERGRLRVSTRESVAGLSLVNWYSDGTRDVLLHHETHSRRVASTRASAFLDTVSDARLNTRAVADGGTPAIAHSSRERLFRHSLGGRYSPPTMPTSSLGACVAIAASAQYVYEMYESENAGDVLNTLRTVSRSNGREVQRWALPDDYATLNGRRVIGLNLSAANHLLIAFASMHQEWSHLSVMYKHEFV